ncbi:hypothetical protein O181_028969 [Austropuccinia psidii MF-1]|uniref:Uncharacterized protein n=1 Tax=Austropuccinia psidii MF-1 TaxID=1389203 RepID=A0A9Q3CQ13_9BASI|nr:hypothetical protein [Austropuccinia psidii MF-1]
MAEVAKKNNYFPHCGSTEHYSNNCPKIKKNIYAIGKVSEKESPTEAAESDSMGGSIREQSDKDKDPIEEFVVEYQQETPLEIQDIQLKAGMPQDTANKKLYNAQHPLIIDSGAHCSKVSRNYLDHYLPNWEKQLLPTKAKNFKSASGKMTSIGFLLDTDYQRLYGIDIYNSKNRHITIGTKKEKKFSLDIYQISTHDSLKELLHEFREGQFSTTLMSKQKLSLLKMLRKNRPAFALGEEPLGKIRGPDRELYLDMERPYPPILRRPPYPASLETRKEIEKQINEILEMDFIRKIGHNEEV